MSRPALVFLSILIIASTGLLAQVEIRVQDEVGNPLPGAHITFQALNSKKTNTVLSDLLGKVNLPISREGAKTGMAIKISFLGYRTIQDTIVDLVNKSYGLSVDEISLNNVVITGEYAPNNPENSVNKVKIIDRQRLDAMGAVNLSDALRYETNIRISQDNILGSSSSVQGISGQNVKIMIDGVPVIGRQDGNIDLNQLNLNNVERIEIIEGPLSVKYGSNALAGTINLISKKSQPEKFHGGLNSYYESIGQYNLDGQLSYRKEKHFISVTGGRNFLTGGRQKTTSLDYRNQR